MFRLRQPFRNIKCYLKDGWRQSGRCLATVPKPVTDDEEHYNAKPLSAMPGPMSLPLLGTIYRLPVFLSDSWHEAMFGWFERYGPIFHEKVGPVEFVMVSDVEGVEKLHRQEGKYPRRFPVYSWERWRDQHDLSRGIVTEYGSEWKKMRATLDKQMLIPRHVALYADDFNKVVTDLIQRMKHIRKSSSNGPTIPNLDQELFHWSLETIGTVLYETRFGGLLENRSPETTRFIKAVQDLFVSTGQINLAPESIIRTFLQKWKKLHDQSWEIIFEATQKLIDGKLSEIQKQLDKGKEVSGFLPFLLSAKMTKNEIYANVTEIMLAAVDTTSNTMQWILYELARNPDIQEKLHAEVTSICPAGKIPSYDDLQEMPLLKAIVKETLRLYPVTVVNSRCLDEDIVLCGYRIPEKSTVITCIYVMGRNPKLFPDPLTFKPERWFRKSDTAETIHNFALLPFGFGSRSCIGRRVAELEMHLLLARISQSFQLKPGDNQIRRSVMRGLLVPDKPVLLNFIDRL